MAVTGLLRLLKEGRAWSVEELAGRLEKPGRHQTPGGVSGAYGLSSQIGQHGTVCRGMRFGLRFRMHTGPGDVRDAGDVGGYKQI